jgi:hypothetical protein
VAVWLGPGADSMHAMYVAYCANNSWKLRGAVVGLERGGKLKHMQGMDGGQEQPSNMYLGTRGSTYILHLGTFKCRKPPFQSLWPLAQVLQKLAQTGVASQGVARHEVSQSASFITPQHNIPSQNRGGPPKSIQLLEHSSSSPDRQESLTI